MAKDIVMLHGASAGGWCFDTFRDVFEGEGWAVQTPDLIGHGRDKEGADRKLVGMGLADYRPSLRQFWASFPRSRCCPVIPWVRFSPSSLPRRGSRARSF